MDAYAKDVIDSLSKLLGLVTVAAGALTFGLQLRRWRHDRTTALKQEERAADQRAEELRWRKASLARDAINAALEDELAADAMMMLDWEGRSYEIAGEEKQVWEVDMLAALRIKNLTFTEKESFIRDCFDAFFGHMQLIQHFLDVSLLELVDVKYPFAYYQSIMARNQKVFDRFLEEYDYDLAQRFLRTLAQEFPRAPKGPAG